MCRCRKAPKCLSWRSREPVISGLLSLSRGPSSLAKSGETTHDFDMSTVTIALPDPLDAALRERMTTVGAHSKEEYLVALIESDCAASELERVLVDRLAGPFEPLETDWKERVRQSAAK
jgi:hypothetical protein